MERDGKGCVLGVVGIGNLLLMDEGIGVHAVRALAEEGLPDAGPVVFVDGGTDPWGAFAAVTGCRALLVLDAVSGQLPPGELHSMDMAEVDLSAATMSLHGHTLFHLLEFESVLGATFEEVRVVGMEPLKIEPGFALSQPCRERLPALIDLTRQEIRRMLDRLAGSREEIRC
jgi:hydrogenase maturation protease